jgi:uncharacterized repeat protein (TIGR01451 family)
MISEQGVIPNGVQSPAVNTPLTRPQLSIVKSNSPVGQVNHGDIITYTLVVTNFGLGAASNIIITDAIPGYTTYVPGSASPAPFSGPSPLVFHLVGSLAAGNSATITFQVTVQTGLPIGSYTISNLATVTANGIDTVTSNTVTNSLTIAPSFGLAKDTPVDVVDTVGAAIPYTITVINDGDAALHLTSITDTLLGSLSGPVEEFAPANGVLDIGESWTYSGTYIVTQQMFDNYGNGVPVPDGIIYNTATATVAEMAQPKSASAEVGMLVDYSIDIQKTPDLQTILSGGTAGFNIVVTNTGEVTLTEVVVSDPLGGGTVNIGTLAPGASYSYSFSVANVISGFTNVATVIGKYSSVWVEDNDNAIVVVEGQQSIGGDVLKESKLLLISPLLAGAMAIAGMGFTFARRRRRTKNPS